MEGRMIYSISVSCKRMSHGCSFVVCFLMNVRMVYVWFTQQRCQ